MAKQPQKRGKVRDNLEAFGVAILAAVLLKYFAIEAYQIPTSSMQPTLMGSDEANVHDRILVDKVRYTLTDPDRWDVVVFRYPLQQNQNYVKRLVGMPGDRLRIRGGNLYRVDAENRIVEALSKPRHIQAGLWKEIYPLRRLLREDDEILGTYFVGQGRWRQDGEDLIAEAANPQQLALLTFSKNADGGIVNQLFDGYPVDVARKIKAAHGSRAGYAVPDVRLSTSVTPGRRAADLQLELQVDVSRPARPALRFSLLIGDGQGRLRVRRLDDREPGREGESFPFELAAGRETGVRFAHLDDELIAWCDGDEVARLSTSDFRIEQGLESSGATVTAGIQLRGGGETRLGDLRLERDLFYTTSTLDEDHVIEVPDGHYFMMGDNTLQSVDSRDWTAITVGLLPDGTMVDPRAHPDARLVRGNKRPVDPSKPTDRDETPIVIPSEDTVVMIDEFGNVLRMKSRISPAYSELTILFESSGNGGDDDWQPDEVKVPFVPREHIIGRALMGFWPFPPFGPNRAGFIR